MKQCAHLSAAGWACTDNEMLHQMIPKHWAHVQARMRERGEPLLLKVSVPVAAAKSKAAALPFAAAVRSASVRASPAAPLLAAPAAAAPMQPVDTL